MTAPVLEHAEKVRREAAAAAERVMQKRVAAVNDDRAIICGFIARRAQWLDEWQRGVAEAPGPMPDDVELAAIKKTGEPLQGFIECAEKLRNVPCVRASLAKTAPIIDAVVAEFNALAEKRKKMNNEPFGYGDRKRFVELDGIRRMHGDNLRALESARENQYLVLLLGPDIPVEPEPAVAKAKKRASSLGPAAALIGAIALRLYGGN